jgi:hypothetical protein
MVGCLYSGLRVFGLRSRLCGATPEEIDVNTNFKKAIAALEAAIAYAEDGAVISAMARMEDALVHLKAEKKRRVKIGLIHEEAPAANAPGEKFPELDGIAESLANTVANGINEGALATLSRCRYKAQYVLERLIQLLQEKV